MARERRGGQGGVRRSTALVLSHEVQVIVRLVSVLTPDAIETTQALVRSNYHANQAAVLLGIESAAVRKRVERIRERVLEALGGLYQPQEVRSVENNLVFGADDRVYRWKGAPEKEESPEVEG